MSPSYQHNTNNIFGYGPPTKVGKAPFSPPGTNKNCETAYWVWGDLTSEVPPLIVLHGGPAAPGREWQAISLLNDKYNIPVIIYDQIGCGESTHLRDTKNDTTFWTENLFLSELQNLIDHLQIQKYHLLGHSCGAMLTVPFALTQPRGLQKLIIASTSASEQLRAYGFKQRYAEMPQQVQDTLHRCENEYKTDSPEYGEASSLLAKHAFCRMDPWPRELDEVMEYMNDDDTVSSTLYGGKPLEPTGPWGKYNVIDRLAEITDKTVPGGVLLTNGKYDVSSDEGMKPFFDNIRARVKWVSFAESAHFAHVEEPERYLTVLGQFLKTP